MEPTHRETFRPPFEEQVMATLRDTKEAVQDVGEDLAEAARGSAQAARSEFSRLGEKLRANSEELGDELADARDRISEGAKKFGDAAADQIREHPLAAFGIAFAAGVLISRMMRR